MKRQDSKISNKSSKKLGASNTAKDIQDAILEEIETTFKLYDDDNNGYLDSCELRSFLDDIRLSLNLPRCDNKIFNKVHRILDVDKNDKVELDE